MTCNLVIYLKVPTIAHREKKKILADEIWAVITLTITCQALRFNLRVHQFSEEEIKDEEEKQSR